MLGLWLANLAWLGCRICRTEVTGQLMATLAWQSASLLPFLPFFFQESPNNSAATNNNMWKTLLVASFLDSKIAHLCRLNRKGLTRNLSTGSIFPSALKAQSWASCSSYNVLPAILQSLDSTVSSCVEAAKEISLKYHVENTRHIIPPSLIVLADQSCFLLTSQSWRPGEVFLAWKSWVFRLRGRRCNHEALVSSFTSFEMVKLPISEIVINLSHQSQRQGYSWAELPLSTPCWFCFVHSISIQDLKKDDSISSVMILRNNQLYFTLPGFNFQPAYEGQNRLFAKVFRMFSPSSLFTNTSKIMD